MYLVCSCSLFFFLVPFLALPSVYVLLRSCSRLFLPRRMFRTHYVCLFLFICSCVFPVSHHHALPIFFWYAQHAYIRSGRGFSGGSGSNTVTTVLLLLSLFILFSHPFYYPSTGTLILPSPSLVVAQIRGHKVSPRWRIRLSSSLV